MINLQIITNSRMCPLQVFLSPTATHNNLGWLQFDFKNVELPVCRQQLHTAMSCKYGSINN